MKEWVTYSFSLHAYVCQCRKCTADRVAWRSRHWSIFSRLSTLTLVRLEEMWRSAKVGQSCLLHAVSPIGLGYTLLFLPRVLVNNAASGSSDSWNNALHFHSWVIGTINALPFYWLHDRNAESDRKLFADGTLTRSGNLPTSIHDGSLPPGEPWMNCGCRIMLVGQFINVSEDSAPGER